MVRWRWAFVGALVLGGVTWLLAGGERGADIADVLALAVSAVGVLFTVISLRRSGDRADRVRVAARELAEMVARRESVALTQLLGTYGDPQPANVEFSQPLAVRWRTDGGQQHGSLAEVAGYYRGLDRGRLVVLGEPGSGKTVLAVRLIIDLLRDRDSDPASARGRQVPVRLSLPTFDPLPGGQALEAVSHQELARRLDSWIAAQLATLGIGELAADLVTKGWILPVLDGLDEMDPDTAPPHRAAAVIRALNFTAGSRPMVLTCRRARYSQLVDTAEDATVVALEPLTPQAVRHYLIHRFPDPTQPDGLASRWHTLAQAMQNADQNREWPRPLVNALRSPWQLFLCTTVFAENSDPYQQLADLTPDELTSTLLKQLVPAAVAQHPKPNGDLYNPEDVTRWLRTLAHHLDQQGTRGGSRSDILLHQLWPAAGPRAPRYVSGTIVAALVALPILLLAGVHGLKFPPVRPVAWLGLTVFGGLLVLIWIWIHASTASGELTRLDSTALQTGQGRRKLLRGLTEGAVFGFAVGFAVGLVFRFVLGIPVGFVFALTTGPMVGFVIGLVSEVGRIPMSVTAPHQLARQGIAHDLVVGLALGLAAGVMFGLWAEPETSNWLAIALAVGLSLAFAGFVLGPSPWPRYLVAVLMLWRRGALPPRPARFLDWAYSAGLVRLAGIGVQFRHQQFQAWLSAPAESPTQSRAESPL